MVRARVTSKGQVTVPVEVRRALGVEPGDDLEFEVREDRAVFKVMRRTPLTALQGALPVSRPIGARDAERTEAGRVMGERLDRATRGRPRGAGSGAGEGGSAGDHIADAG